MSDELQVLTGREAQIAIARSMGVDVTQPLTTPIEVPAALRRMIPFTPLPIARGPHRCRVVHGTVFTVSICSVCGRRIETPFAEVKA